MKLMGLRGLHLGEKLQKVLHTLKGTEKEANAAETNTTECPTGEKRNRTHEELLDFLIPKMLECMKTKIDSLPDQGKFDPHSVAITYPGTTCEASLIYKYDSLDEDQRNRRLMVAMRRQGYDRMVSIYLFKGSKEECLAWLEKPGNLEVLKKDYAELFSSVKQAEE